MPSKPFREAAPDLEQDGIWIHLSSYDWHEILGKNFSLEIQERIRTQVKVAAQAERVWAANAKKPVKYAKSPTKKGSRAVKDRGSVSDSVPQGLDKG